jgi:hypothetical protein
LNYSFAGLTGGDQRTLAKGTVLEIQAYRLAAVRTNSGQFLFLIDRPEDFLYGCNSLADFLKPAVT